MFLAEKTVKNYVSSILAKLGLERRTQAAVLASKLLGDTPTLSDRRRGRDLGPADAVTGGPDAASVAAGLWW